MAVILPWPQWVKTRLYCSKMHGGVQLNLLSKSVTFRSESRIRSWLLNVVEKLKYNSFENNIWLYMSYIQYIPRNMHTVFALLCFVVVIHWLIYPCPSGLLHWHCGNLMIAPVPAKQPWWIWINTSCEFIMNDCITTTKQSTTKPCAYFLGYTVCMVLWDEKLQGILALFPAKVYLHRCCAIYNILLNRLVSQMRESLAACCEPAGKLWQLCKVLYVFENKTQSFNPCSIYPHCGILTHQ